VYQVFFCSSSIISGFVSDTAAVISCALRCFYDQMIIAKECLLENFMVYKE